MSTKPLSKSKLMRGIQCPKNLWLHLHRPELEPKTDTATQMQFDEGNEVGELARKYFGKGVLIDNDYWDYAGAHRATQKAIADGEKIIFEASFLVDGLYARADILKKTRSGWQMFEVKKSTAVKNYHYEDAATQAYIIRSSGLILDSVSITYINNESIYPDLSDLFTSEDITSEIDSLEDQIVKKISALKKIVKKTSEPEVKIGPHCDDPFGCGFKEHCWKHIPKKSVFDLPGVSSKKAWELVDSGLVKISDLDPRDYKGKTKRAIEVTKKKKAFVDSVGIETSLKNWAWPLYFFDFETLGPAIPRYKGTKPYVQVPFQFSCHVWKSSKHKTLDHFEYLHTENSDPRTGIINSMLDGLGTEGSIVSYNMAFEKGVIKKLAEFDRKNSKNLMALLDRFVDPLPIFREHIYHPEFLGSFSIKSVAPALIGETLNYDDLEIGDGSTAQAHADLILRGLISGKTKETTIENLLTYCRQDTLAMVELVKWLMNQ